MSDNDMGFFEGLLEDICNAIEIEGAVEATRDKNGKVDKWAATGLAMGLGHTSDDEMAILAGLLGAEGAFDDDAQDEYIDTDDIFDNTKQTNFEFASSDETEEDYSCVFNGNILIYPEDVEQLVKAGYEVLDLELMETQELKEAMEKVGIDTSLYEFE